METALVILVCLLGLAYLAFQTTRPSGGNWSTDKILEAWDSKPRPWGGERWYLEAMGRRTAREGDLKDYRP